VLPGVWCDAYEDGTPNPTNILEFEVDGYTFLYDFNSGMDWDDSAGELQEDRAVAAYGRSQRAEEPRDASRQKGFPLSPRDDWCGTPYDRGHLMAHAAGGPMDVNFFPQRADLNRGRTEEGKRFRAMERYCVEHPGTFVFARLLYGDLSWRPDFVEYGMLREDGVLEVERFDNRPCGAEGEN
jgi:hypothetical protein